MLNARSLQGLKVIALIAGSHQPVNSKQLSLELRLSISYIEGLLKDLKQAGLVVATRGPGGGYLLPHSARVLSAWDVVSCFEQEESEAMLDRTDEYVSSLAVGHELHEIKKGFLQNFPIAKMISDIPMTVKPSSALQLSRHFKPLRPAPMPRAPNSVFDLSKFMQLHTADASAV
jgi:Rrf2 family iron-sulfur cluster assembly transcriptional regulator